MNKRWILLTSLVLFGALSRLIPHPPNFTAVCALSLLAGSQFERKSWAFLVPLLSLFISDLFLGFYSGLALVYLCTGLNVLLGFRLRKTTSFLKFSEYSVVSSLVFFAVTNFGVWAFEHMYPPTLAGLGTCYLMGLPFLANMLLGNFFYIGVTYLVLKHQTMLLPQVKIKGGV